MAAEALTELLDASGVSYELLPHAHTERAAEEAAALGVPPDSVAKTLVLTMPDGYVRTVLSAADRLDLHKVCEVLDAGSKKNIHLASEDELERDFPEFELGAVPPVGGRKGPGADRPAYVGAGGDRVRGRRPRRIRAPAGGRPAAAGRRPHRRYPRRLTVRLCLMVEGQEDVSWDEWLALADVCERAGLDGLFRSDHYLSVVGRRERASHDAIATLAALAARTERIRLGTLVSPVTFRHPSVLAKSVATIDHVSGGRVELGLGAGWNEGEHAAYGFDFPPLGTRMELLEEQLEIVHRLWTEDSVSFAGRHYRLDDCPALPRPLQQPRPPLILGGNAKPRSVALAVRLADEYNTLLASIDDCRERKSVLVEACEVGGRDPATLPLTLMATCIVGRTGQRCSTAYAVC